MDKGASLRDRATHERNQQAVSAVPVGIPSAEYRDAVTMFVGASRQLWRAVMVGNNCVQARCSDINDENCICLADYTALASSAFNVPDMVLSEDATATIQEQEKRK